MNGPLKTGFLITIGVLAALLIVGLLMGMFTK